MNLQQQINDVQILSEGRISIQASLWDLIPKTPFDRVYLDRYNNLNCKPDIEFVTKLTAKQVTNVMAAWQCYKRSFGMDKTRASDQEFVVYAPNKRMATFLRHMTKWQIHSEKPPIGEFFFFGVNSDRKELQDVARTGNYFGFIVVGTTQVLVNDILLYADSYTDAKILGPNRTVSYS